MAWRRPCSLSSASNARPIPTVVKIDIGIKACLDENLYIYQTFKHTLTYQWFTRTRASCPDTKHCVYQSLISGVLGRRGIAYLSILMRSRDLRLLDRDRCEGTTLNCKQPPSQPILGHEVIFTSSATAGTSEVKSRFSVDQESEVI